MTRADRKPASGLRSRSGSGATTRDVLRGLGQPLAALAWLGLCGCPASDSHDTEPGATQAPPDAASITFVESEGGEEGRRQTLRVVPRPDGRMHVEASIEGACQRQVRGLAEAPEPGDPGTFDAQDGSSVPADTFLLLEEDCAVAVSLDWLERRYAWLDEGGCEEACRFSGRVMIRQPGPTGSH